MGIYDPARDSSYYTPELLARVTYDDVLAAHAAVMDAKVAGMRRWADASRISEETLEAICIYETLELNYFANLC